MTSIDGEKLKECQKTDNFCQVGDTFCQQPAPKGWEKATFFNPMMSDFEREIKDSMVGNVIEHFEKTLMNEVKKFDEIKRESQSKQAQNDKDSSSQHIPPTLNNKGVDIRTLWQRVNSLILDKRSVDDNILRKASMKSLTPEVYQILISHGISAWLSTLSRDHLEVLSQHIYSETSQWISRIWRFRCSATLFHNKLYDGILNVCRTAMVSQFPKYETEGYNALYSRPPVIYFNCASEPALIDYVRINLGLPSSSICLVPNNFELVGDESMDVIALEQLILADTSAGKMPLVVCAYAGSPNIGSMDRLTNIHELCRNHRIWLHIEGFRLSELALLHVPAKVNLISSKVKSMTLDLGSWLGIASVPYVTLVMTKVSPSYLNSLGFGPGYFTHNSTNMDIFPLWLSLQLIGHDGIVNKIENQTRMNQMIVMKLKEINNIKLISRTTTSQKKTQKLDNKIPATPSTGMKGLMDTVLTFLLEGHQIPFVIVFRYDPIVMANCNGGDEIVDSGTEMPNGKASSSNETIIRKPRFVASSSEDSQIYRNSLNQWLADNLIGSFPQMNISVINLPSEGMCLRLCIHENNIGQDLTDETLERFFDSIGHHVAIMNATVNQRSTFKEIVKTKSQLLHADLPSWAGLGCVLFVPDIFRRDLKNILVNDEIDINNDDFINFISTPNVLHDINKVNKILLDELRSDDEAFSLGIYHFTVPEHLTDLSHEEQAYIICVRFGLITETTTVEQLVQLVISKGEQVEASTRDFEMLSQLVKEGIDKVTEELAKEHQEKLKQDGVFRQVPYIDSIINWWSPSDKNQIKGRRLNLSSGEIQLTDDIYKYKLQLQVAGSQSVFSVNSNNNSTKEATIDSET